MILTSIRRIGCVHEEMTYVGDTNLCVSFDVMYRMYVSVRGAEEATSREVGRNVV